MAAAAAAAIPAVRPTWRVTLVGFAVRPDDDLDFVFHPFLSRLGEEVWGRWEFLSPLEPQLVEAGVGYVLCRIPKIDWQEVFRHHSHNF